MPTGPSPVLPGLHGAPRLQCAHTQAAEAGKKDESSKRKPPSHLLVSAAPSWVNPEPSRPGAGCDQESSPFTRSTTSQPQTVQQRSPLLRNEAGHQGFYYENSYVWDWFDYFSNTTGAKQNMSVEFGQGATDPQPCFPAFRAAKALLGFSKLPIWIHKFVTNLEKAFPLHVTLPSLTYTSGVIFL